MGKRNKPQTGGAPRAPISSMALVGDLSKAYQRSASRKSAPATTPLNKPLTRKETKRMAGIGDQAGLAFLKLLRYAINPRFDRKRITAKDAYVATTGFFPSFTTDEAQRTLTHHKAKVVRIFTDLTRMNHQEAAQATQDFLDVAVAQLAE